MRQKIKFEDIHQLETVLESLPSDIKEFGITIEDNGDAYIEIPPVDAHGQLIDGLRGPLAYLHAGPPRSAEYMLMLIPKREPRTSRRRFGGRVLDKSPTASRP